MILFKLKFQISNNPLLRELVIILMFHNLCGDFNSNASCMINRNGKFQWHFCFPRQYNSVKSLLDAEKPMYQHCYDPKLDEMNREKFSHNHAAHQKDSNEC